MWLIELLRTCAVPPGCASEIIDGMCTRRSTLLASAMVIVLSLTACGSAERTGTSFCQQLAKEIPSIALPMETSDDIKAMVARYTRLLERAPLTIEGDLAILTDLLRQAANLNPKNSTEVQSLADASYAANKSSLAVREWVKSTCAVDISTGLTIEPPRLPTTTVATTTSTTVAPAPPAVSE